MIKQAPHFLLLSETTDRSASRSQTLPHGNTPRGGKSHKCWHFVIRSADGDTELDEADIEQGASPERLELLAVVRGLEALPEPSRVTLLTNCGAIRRGLRFGLDHWRENRWRWERFGRMTPIKNADLWRRIDRALDFHDIECRAVGPERPTDDLTERQPVVPGQLAAAGLSAAGPAEVSGVSPQRSAGRRGGAWRTGRWVGQLRRLFSWCGLCRSPAGLVIAAS